ncbi:MAG: substrate-binding domain-containing protein [Caulobacteraceae bacterium]|nr:substrate-binding domain-containing protein [Caulobacteraceae bacterium]
MSSFKLRALLGVSALAAASALAASASATTTIYGGGSSLLAPYWNQTANCYDADTGAYLVKGTPATSVSTSTPSGVTCSPTTGNAIAYDSTGSGSGIGAVYAHTPTVALFGSTDSAGTIPVYSTVNYGLSDNSLVTADLSVYNSGGTEGSGSSAVTVVAPGVTPGTGQYGNPKSLYGALVQFPVSVDPVAIAYSPVYKKVLRANGSVTTYSFNVQSPNSDSSGGLKLDATTYCKILSGQISNWNDSALTALNGGVSLADPSDPNFSTFSVPLQIVGRSDSSGTTSILTRHLAAVCGTGNAFGTAGSTTLPSSLQGPIYDKTLSNNNAVSGESTTQFTRAAGSDGVAKYVAFTALPTVVGNANAIYQGRIGYVGSDYALPAVTNTGANTYNLNVADLKNSNGDYVEPTGATALTAFGSILPPQSTSTGAYSAGVTANGLRNDPTAWVQSTSATAPLATPSAANAYPIVGTTNFLGYTCYSDASRLALLNAYLTFQLTNSNAQTILAKAGLAALPSAWTTAITNTFTNSAGDASSLNLFFAQAGSSSSNTACQVSTVVGG